MLFRSAALSVTYTPERLWRVSYHPAQNPDEPVILAEDPTTIYYPGFTQDGKTVVFLMRNARSTHDLYAVPVDGSLPRPACAIKGTYYASPASVHPDGKRILLYGVSGATQITVTGLN